MEDSVNTLSFTILQDHLIPDLVNIIKEYSELPSWIYIGAEVYSELTGQPYIIENIHFDCVITQYSFTLINNFKCLHCWYFCDIVQHHSQSLLELE